MNTIDRATSLYSTNDKGKAIHLDSQQRLLVVNAMGKYCAEPSPDAMAAFAAAAGIDASAPTQDAVSAAGSMSSAAASIGLRTQSITLMRDALYRMCEAYGNRMLNQPQVMTLLSRSQDLTAVILATEQLTGAVVAQQAALSDTASAGAALSGGGERSRLSDQSSQAIAAAVSSMVNNVLNKSYVLDYCMAMISSNDNEDATNDKKDATNIIEEAEDRVLCRKIVEESMGVEELRVTGTFGSDINIINCIKAWLNLDVANKARLDQWRKENADGLDHVSFMFGKNAASLRSAAIKELSIPCN